VCVNQYIFDLIDDVEYVVYALYSSILNLELHGILIMKVLMIETFIVNRY
jgi:hypothetical protein